MNFEDYQFIHKLRNLPFIEEIWLYGSRARGDHTNRSDIDIAILCPKATDADWLLISDILEDADTLLKIDYVRFDSLAEDNSLRKNILKFKKVIYKKGTDFMEKALWKDYFETLGKAVNRLGELINHPDLKKIDYLQDAVIQRFEFCTELYWKVLKKFLAYEEVDTTTPRDVISKAFQYKFIDDEKIWLQMLRDRNRTSHIYKEEEEAKRVFENIIGYWPVIEKTYQQLEKKFYS